MMPLHEAATNLFSQVRDLQRLELMRLNQGYDRCRVPGGDDVQIRREVAVVLAAPPVRLLFPRGECDSDAAVARLDRCM
jgi:hypothetical protein